MTDPHARPAEARLGRALEGLAVFRGATACQEETNCECHWGSAEELALLKVPDVTLDPDLLRRTWQPSGWNDHGAVLRRILPQLAGALVDSRSESFGDRDDIGASLFRGGWQGWPHPQAAAVRELLDAFWAHSLVTAGPVGHISLTLALCVEASGELRPRLDVWEALDHPTADRNLAEAVEEWDYDLLVDELPWDTRHDKDEMLVTLVEWLTRRAPARLGPHNAPDDLLQRLRLIGLTGEARWNDPHWPGYRYSY